jgi:Bacteriophage tail sheath protein
MTTYLSPGVYVQEMPSALQTIVGVGTSTAAFIGIIPDSIDVPVSAVASDLFGVGDGKAKQFNLANYPVLTDLPYSVWSPVQKETPVQEETVDGPALKLANYPVDGSPGTFAVRVNGRLVEGATLNNDTIKQVAHVVFTDPPPTGAAITVDYRYTPSGVTIQNDDTAQVAHVNFSSPPGTQYSLFASYLAGSSFTPLAAGQVQLCTSFTDFTKSFGGFSTHTNQNYLAHAVYGFFTNGGTRCYVVREPPGSGSDPASIVAPLENNLSTLLGKLEAIDEIAIVAAPGITDKTIYNGIIEHCENLGNRFAILDTPEDLGPGGFSTLSPSNPGIWPGNSSYAALYFPWIEVYDPAKQVLTQGQGHTYMPPSGHVAGIYARVDTQRGVYKAPANEVVLDALSLQHTISKSQQDGLNPQGVNCIRYLNGNILVWGARTLGGDANGDWKYINVRRVFLFLRNSIDQGTQWVVFEPNDTSLWGKIRRSVTAFLTNVWRAGALFGDTAQQAFFVKCDAENNPPDVRDQGQVIIDIGVAIVRPAEFVIFRISQWEAPTKS